MPVATLQPFQVRPRAFHELIILPEFGDTIDTNNVPQPSPEEGDWMIMDGVVAKRPILELSGGQNVLKRRDATCKLIYSPIGRLSARYIYSEELYAATEDCQKEFYQGCFEDYEQGNFDMFMQNIMPMLERAVGVDLYTNKYFGDVTRTPDVNGIWSWNKFDGIFTHLARYYAEGDVPASQAFTLPSGELTAQQAFDALATAYARQTFVMKSIDTAEKAFYVDQELNDAYWDYLVLTGSCNQNSLFDRQRESPTLYFRGIEIKVKRWDGILAALNGGEAAHICLLSVRGNFLFATDSNYGGGPRMNEAVRIWYSMDDDVWRRQIHVRAGTEWAAPTFTVLGMTSF